MSTLPSHLMFRKYATLADRTRLTLDDAIANATGGHTWDAKQSATGAFGLSCGLLEDGGLKGIAFRTLEGESVKQAAQAKELIEQGIVAIERSPAPAVDNAVAAWRQAQTVLEAIVTHLS